MFSTTTMALSTSMPRARIRLNSTTMFMLMPRMPMTMKLRSMLRGIDVATKPALRTPRKNISTASTSSSPLMMLFSRLLTMSWMSSDWSLVIFTTVPGGNPLSMAPISAFTRSAVSMMFSPERFTIPSVMTGVPSSRANVSRSL